MHLRNYANSSNLAECHRKFEMSLTPALAGSRVFQLMNASFNKLTKYFKIYKDN